MADVIWNVASDDTRDVPIKRLCGLGVNTDVSFVSPACLVLFSAHKARKPQYMTGCGKHVKTQTLNSLQC